MATNINIQVKRLEKTLQINFGTSGFTKLHCLLMRDVADKLSYMIPLSAETK